MRKSKDPELEKDFNELFEKLPWLQYAGQPVTQFIVLRMGLVAFGEKVLKKLPPYTTVRFIDWNEDRVIFHKGKGNFTLELHQATRLVQRHRKHWSIESPVFPLSIVPLTAPGEPELSDRRIVFKFLKLHASGRALQLVADS